MPTLMICNQNVKNTKYYLLNDFLLSKVNEANPEKLKEDLLTIINYYEKIVDRISDFSFVVQELNVNNFAAYAQQLVVLMLNLVRQARESAIIGSKAEALKKFQMAATIGQELSYNSHLRECEVEESKNEA